jgi:hypothetical protein
MIGQARPPSTLGASGEAARAEPEGPRGRPFHAIAENAPHPRSVLLGAGRVRRTAAESNPDEPMDRSEPRQPRSEEAVIACDGEAFTRPCTLTNLSSRGARLEVPGTHQLPEQFMLLIPNERRLARARLVWRRPGICGVKFLSS